jgi:uncharacterized protein (TIGR02453 family)
MAAAPFFGGFPREAVAFYRDLARHNDRAWFEAHKQQYREQVLRPAQEFVLALGARLRTIAPGVVVDTGTDGAGSIFRIYRDTRFSSDKSPYKTYLGIFFWEGAGKKMESSGFYFHLEPPRLMLAAGIYLPALLPPYRQALQDEKMGPALLQAIEQVTAGGCYQVGGRHYKKVPRGFSPRSEAQAGLLLHNGLYASVEGPIPTELFTPACVDYCFERCREMAPIHRWVVEMVQRAPRAAA